jgi:hypothetical protein
MVAFWEGRNRMRSSCIPGVAFASFREGEERKGKHKFTRNPGV